jgi:hypothetical protein
MRMTQTHKRANKERIMSAKVHATIGVSPAELLFGQSIKLYTGLISASFPESLTKGIEAATVGRTSDNVARLVKVQHNLIEIA